MNYKRLYRSSRVWVACDLKLREALLGPFLAAYLPILALFSSVCLLYFEIYKTELIGPIGHIVLPPGPENAPH